MQIVSRAAWGANPLHTPAGSIAIPTPNLWLHHTASTGLHGAAGMRSLQQGALNGGYLDIEYSYVVDTDGAVYEARGIGRDTAAQGASGTNNNAVAHAICAMGNYDPPTGNQQPTQQLVDSIADVVRYLHERGAIASPRITGPHRDAPKCSTACCGQNLIVRIDEINRKAGSGSSGGTSPAPGPPIPGGDDVPASKDFVDAYASADGAWRLQYDGGVETIRGPFYGSYFTLAASVRNDPSRRFLTICAPVDGSPRGFSLVSLKGEAYTFSKPQEVNRRGREVVALVLAGGLSVGTVLICAAVFLNAVQHQEPLSDNATQVLTAVFGGIIGVLGSYLGFRAAERKYRPPDDDGDGD